MNKANWSDKYRPQKIEDLVLPTGIKSKLLSISGGKSGFMLLLYGQPGCGKTTTATLIKKYDTWKLDPFQQKTAASMLKEYNRVLSGVTLNSERRVVLIDEIDMLSQDLQKAICQLIDKHAVNNDFVATTNYIERICSPLRSRLNGMSFDFMRDGEYLKQIEVFLFNICQLENRSDIDHAVIRAIVKSNFPDIRKMIIQLQHELT